MPELQPVEEDEAERPDIETVEALLGRQMKVRVKAAAAAVAAAASAAALLAEFRAYAPAVLLAPFDCVFTRRCGCARADAAYICVL